MRQALAEPLANPARCSACRPRNSGPHHATGRRRRGNSSAFARRRTPDTRQLQKGTGLRAHERYWRSRPTSSPAHKALRRFGAPISISYFDPCRHKRTAVVFESSGYSLGPTCAFNATRFSNWRARRHPCACPSIRMRPREMVFSLGYRVSRLGQDRERKTRRVFQACRSIPRRRAADRV